jgi:mannose-1-phosphate guanylyltransferase
LGYPGETISMKAFIMAAGSGTRLQPLTHSVPKCLLPIRGAPLLQVWLESCRIAGITDVLINAHSHAEQVKDFAKRQSTSLRIRIAEEKQLLGSAGTLAENRDFACGETAFFVLYGDVLTNVALTDMLTFHAENKVLATLGVCRVPNPSQCGIVTFDRNHIVRGFVEKPAQPPGNWAFSGVMIAGPQIFDFVPAHRPADIGFDLLPRLAGQMAAYPISAYLRDIGTLESYRAAQTSWPGLAQITGLTRP